MKRLKRLTFGILTAALFLTYSPVRADEHRDKHDDGSLYGGASDKWHNWNDDDNKQDKGGSGSGNSGSTNLPANDNVWLLVIFGAAIGAKAITDKVKFSKS